MRTSNSEPWHGQTITLAVELALGERALLVRARVVEGDPPGRGAADAPPRPATSTLRSVLSGRSPAAPTSCQGSIDTANLDRSRAAVEAEQSARTSTAAHDDARGPYDG